MASLGALTLLLLLLLFSSSASSRRVSLAIYYESLCPYCSSFIVDRLPSIFNNGLISYVDLHLVPFGNAEIGSDGSITCQHGSDECFLNYIEACAISVWPDPHVHFSFIHCVENLVEQNLYNQWSSCFRSTGLNSQPVVDCYNKGTGSKLELQYAAQTNALQPPHQYVPWVLVDGQPLYSDYNNFEAYICNALNGELPTACEGHSLMTFLETDTNRTAGVCRIH
ncbi:gamma-interferon-responsive lysosomal thiol protein-like [Dioscorea cayenensis subsp. rotundata]|uniref:Gamma-interferon-responsive lysosomal thiol protein-like n=1 Tax=Dioscorea cayennensis subsp. rotundata TaxID=55577 RepID=A0AB40BWW7_DIOCR|nr:gamma-interferon-responsive lysosomal thiol protein-like [Dioscorea cayenensis subsp. rotundata]